MPEPRKPIISIKKTPPTIMVPRKATLSITKGDVLNVLKDLESNSFDGSLQDPPYALTTIIKRYGKANSKPPKTDKGSKGAFGRIARGFMNKEWDGQLPSVEVFQQLLRVCKPGSTLLSFGHPRTHHRLMCNMEDAGWDIRDTVLWLHGKGLPKSRDIWNDIDRILKAERNGFADARWLGYGTALKPAYEPIIVAMKPFEQSFATNALKWGVAGINIVGSRVNGRFPANIILDDEAGRLLDMQGPTSKGGTYRKSGSRALRHKGKLLYGGGIGGGEQNAPDNYGDAGGPSRFYYCSQSSRYERGAGLEGFPIKRPDTRPESSMGFFKEHGIQPQENHHPAVKPLDLCRYLADLILPPERESPRRLLVPYAGVASEMIGAMQAGWDEILGIEMDQEYIDIGHARIAYWRKGMFR